MLTGRIDLQQPIAPLKPSVNPSGKTREIDKNNSFQQLLERELAATGLKFSQHALKRLESRGIELSPHDLTKLEGAVEKVDRKGAKDSLILMNDLALIVSVTNKTVITALDGNSRRENVFTNIDSAVIL